MKSTGMGFKKQINLKESQTDIGKRIIEIQCQLEDIHQAIFWMTDPYNKNSFFGDLGRQRWGSVEHASAELRRAKTKIEELELKISDD